MAGIQDLPVDMRQGIARGTPSPAQNPVTGQRFIGGAAKEYPNLEPRQAVEPAVAAPPEKPVVAPAPSEGNKPCPRCDSVTSVVPAGFFCPVCGLDLKKKSAAATIGIEIKDEDVEDYIFKGFLTKAVTLFGNHVATFKSVQSNEVDAADRLTAEHFTAEKRNPGDIEFLNYRAKVLMSFGWVKLDGKSIGATPEERLKYIENAGSQLVELIGKKFNLYNAAITEALNGEVLKNS